VKLAREVAAAGAVTLLDAACPGPDVPVPTGTNPATAFRALADAGAILPVASFLALATGDTKSAAAAAPEVVAALPGALARTLADPLLEARIGLGDYEPAAAAVDNRLSTWAAKVARDRGVLDAQVERRLQRAALLPPPAAKAAAAAAAVTDGAAKLACEYVLYQLAALAAIRSAHGDAARFAPILAARGNSLASM
jgi:hypothetical protein